MKNKKKQVLTLFKFENGFVVPGRMHPDVNGGAFIESEIPIMFGDLSDEEKDNLRVIIYDIKMSKSVDFNDLGKDDE